jgi:dihydroflavonol-4-reductase
MLRRSLLVIPGANTGLSFVHVDDVAEGHVLAAEKGQIGHSYILGGDVMTIGNAAQVIARLAGVPAPLLLFDAHWVARLRPLLNRAERFIALPPLISSEMVQTLGHTWWVTSNKAKRDLGYTFRSLEEGMAETVLWEAAQLQRQPVIVQPKTLLVLSIVAFMFGAILSQYRRKNK